jgi:AraC-like DNA-binding protein
VQIALQVGVRCAINGAGGNRFSANQGSSLQSQPERQPADADASPGFVRAAVVEIERGLGDVLRPTDVARRVGVSRRHLDRLFAVTHGKSVCEFIRWRRLHIAAERVAGGWKIEAAAMTSGFRSRRHSYRAFKHEFGVAPGAFRVLKHRAES